MKRYLKTIVGMGMAGMIVTMTCTSCTNKTIGSPKRQNKEMTNEEQKQNEKQKQNEEQKQKDFMDNADLEGHVVEFSESEFQMSPVKTLKDESGGTTAIGAEPGKENPDELITITYAKDVTFEILTMDMETLTEVSREKTDKETLKKQSNVLVFGDCQDEKHWIAKKVILVRWNNV